VLGGRVAGVDATEIALGIEGAADRRGEPALGHDRAQLRMAYIATVTLHDAEGDAICTIRYGRMPKRDVRRRCRALARDVTAMRAQRPELKVAYLTDDATVTVVASMHMMGAPSA